MRGGVDPVDLSGVDPVRPRRQEPVTRAERLGHDWPQMRRPLEPASGGRDRRRSGDLTLFRGNRPEFRVLDIAGQRAYAQFNGQFTDFVRTPQ